MFMCTDTETPGKMLTPLFLSQFSDSSIIILRRTIPMFDSKTVSLGIAPIGWCNDDMPELGDRKSVV